MLRKCNAVISMLILALFILHAVAGGFQLTGVIPGGNRGLTVLARGMVVLVGIHMTIGIILTFKSLAGLRRSGKGSHYFRQNLLFRTRRISGFALMFFILYHVLLFLGESGDVYRLKLFAGPELASQILLVLSLIIHLLTNIRPLMIALGIDGGKAFVKDILFVLAVVLLLCGAAFVVYYLRWNVLWRYR